MPDPELPKLVHFTATADEFDFLTLVSTSFIQHLGDNALEAKLLATLAAAAAKMIGPKALLDLNDRMIKIGLSL